MTTLASSLVGSSLEVHFLQISPFTCVSATNKTQQLSLSRSLSHSTTLKLHTKNYKIKMFPSQQTTNLEVCKCNMFGIFQTYCRPISVSCPNSLIIFIYISLHSSTAYISPSISPFVTPYSHQRFEVLISVIVSIYILHKLVSQS